MPADLPTLQRSPMPRQRLSSTGRYGTSERPPDPSGLMPGNWITFAHFSDSVAKKAPKSGALKIIGMVPSSASRDLMVGFASPALISWLRRAMISGGVPFGTPTPAHVLASYPGTVSAIVGTSGSMSNRLLP